jgi:hypothetical protein
MAKRGKLIKNPLLRVDISGPRQAARADGPEPPRVDFWQEYIWVDDDEDGGSKAGRHPNLTKGQVTRGRSLLRDKLSAEPAAFALKKDAVAWLRQPAQGLQIKPHISDDNVRRHIVNSVWLATK